MTNEPPGSEKGVGTSPPYPIERGLVRSPDGTGIAWSRLGSGPPLVICHGSFAVADDWLDFAQAMAATRTVYLYDRRGRGSSPYVRPEFAVEAEVEDLGAVMALAGPHSALIGHSFGGGCALAFAARGWFAGPLVLYEPRHSILGPVSRGHAGEVEALFLAGSPEAAMECVLAKVVGMPADVVERFREAPLWEKMCATVGAFANEVRLLDSLAWQPGDLDLVQGHVSLLIGERSHATPEEAAADAALKAVLPSVATLTIPGQGHFAYATSPGDLAEIVSRCLEMRSK